MDKKLKVLLIIIGILMVIFVAVLIGKSINKPKNNENNNNNNNQNNVEKSYEEKKETIDLAGTENLDVKEDGTTINTSDKLKNDKTVNGLSGVKITGMDVKFLKTETLILGTIKNTTDKDIEVGDLKVQILKEDGSVFKEFFNYVGKLKANSERKIDISTQADISNMSDIAFIK